MKKLITIIYLFLFGISMVNAQPPQGINYQAVARDAGGALLANTNISVRISVLDGSPTGTVQYMETHAVSTNAFGLFSIIIGQGTAGSGTFNAVTWGSGSKYFKVEVDPAGGSAYVNMGTFQVWSVPYALNALNTINDMDKQQLSLVGNNLSISNGNSVSLPAYLSSVATNATLTGNGTTGSTLGLAQQGATNGQTLKWNGSSWLPSNDNDGQTLSLVANNLTISGGNMVTLGDNNSTNEIQSLSLSGNDLSITGGNTVNLPFFSDKFWKHNGIHLYYDTTYMGGYGRIGIGTSSPAAPLHIVNSLSAFLRLEANGGGGYAGVSIDRNTSGNGYLIYKTGGTDKWYVGSIQNDDFAVSKTFTVADGTFYISRSSGRIGIGTTSPSSNIHVENTVSSFITIKATGSSGYAGIDIDRSGTGNGYIIYKSGGTSKWYAGNINSDDYSISKTYLSSDGTFYIKNSNGFVGLGTTNPSYPFNLETASSQRHSGYFENSYACGLTLASTVLPLTGSTCSVIGEYTGTGGNDGIGVYGRSMNTSANSGYGGYFDGKYVGVVGRAFTGGFTGIYACANGATNAIYINGNIAGTGTNNYTSDAKLKKNIQPIEGALDKIMKMKPSLYEFRVGEFGSMELPKGYHFGLVAQDLQEIYPSLVIENDFLGEGREGNFKYLGINYQELTPILIKAVQEQQTQIQTQTRQIQLLLQEIQNLKLKIGELEKKTN